MRFPSEFVDALCSVASKEFDLLSATPPKVWVPVAVLTAISYALARATWEFARFLFRSDRGSIHQLTVVVGAGSDEDPVYLSADTMDQFFGTSVRPEFVVLKGTGKSLRVPLARRKSTTLSLDHIEVSSAIFHQLFPKDDVPKEGEAKGTALRISPYDPVGLNGYWNPTNRRTQFANRFAVYLSVGLVLLQFVIEFGFKS